MISTDLHFKQGWGLAEGQQMHLLSCKGGDSKLYHADGDYCTVPPRKCRSVLLLLCRAALPSPASAPCPGTMSGPGRAARQSGARTTPRDRDWAVAAILLLLLLGTSWYGTDGSNIPPWHSQLNPFHLSSLVCQCCLSFCYGPILFLQQSH